MIAIQEPTHAIPEQRVLALNLGSATLKAAVFELGASARPEHALLQEVVRVDLPHHEDVVPQLRELLQSLPDLAGPPKVVVHRIVHGGERTEGAELDDALLAELDSHAMLAPLHQPAALALARAGRSLWPRARHGVAFDTSFHSTLAPWSRRLPIPAEWADAGLRRYGFHGLAFASALRKVGEVSPSIRSGRVVLAHLGGGCSVCAVENERSVDTTMSLTPLGGVPGPSRSGDLDPGLLLHLLRDHGVDRDTLEKRLSRRSGLAGIAGNGDMRLLLVRHEPAAALAVEQFTRRVAQAIAAMGTAVGGVDHLVFSGGIGHHSPVIRATIAAHLHWLGVSLDDARNAGGEMLISRAGGPDVWNVAVDEERELALSALTWLNPASRLQTGAAPG